MKTSRLGAGSAVAFLLALLLAGCGSSQRSGNPADALDPASDSSSTASEFSSPASEGSGLESPQPSQDDGPSITVASLPVGGVGTPDPANPDQQCGSVNWLLDTLPAGVVVELGAVSLNPSGVFQLGGSGCGADQSQCGAGLRWTEGSSGCSVPVTQLRADADATVTIEVAGRIRCPDRQTCDGLAKQLSRHPGSQAVLTAVPHEAGSSGGAPSDGSSAGESPSGESPSGG